MSYQNFKKSRLFPSLIVVLTIALVGQLDSRFLLASSEKRVLPDQSKTLTQGNALDYQKILEKAEQKGSVRVIVGVKTDFQPEGSLATINEVNNQRQRIKSGQDKILQKIDRIADNSVKKYEYVPYLALKVTKEELEKLNSSGEVVSIQEDVPVPPILDTSIPVIDANLAWAEGYTGAGWTVAILDTGVDKTHEFLTSKVVSEACYSTNDAGEGSSSVCPGGVESSTATGAGVNCSTSIYGCDHGTHVAGIAAGSGDTFSGVAPDANIIAVQVFSRFDDGVTTYCSDSGLTSPCALTWTSDQISGLDRVYALRDTYNIASANMSLGGGAYSAYCDTDTRKTSIDNLRSDGIATAIATGNDGYWGSISAPACISSAIAVGASTDDDAFTLFSNIDEITDMVAPGESINSSVPGDAYESWDGTSMATPHVAGTWAVMKSKRASATVSEIETALENTGTTITETWFSVTISLPRIDVDNALDQLTADACVVPGSGNWTVSLNCTISGSETAAGNVTVQDGVTLTIANTGTLDINFETKYLYVENGGKVYIRNGGKIT